MDTLDTLKYEDLWESLLPKNKRHDETCKICQKTIHIGDKVFKYRVFGNKLFKFKSKNNKIHYGLKLMYHYNFLCSKCAAKLKMGKITIEYDRTLVPDH